MGRTIHLHPADNCLVALENIAAGDNLDAAGGLKALQDIPLGHKVAKSGLLPGDKVIKYGASIGSVTAAIRAGEHIHTHNLKSDYKAGHGRMETGPIENNPQSKF